MKILFIFLSLVLLANKAFCQVPAYSIWEDWDSNIVFGQLDLNNITFSDVIFKKNDSYLFNLNPTFNRKTNTVYFYSLPFHHHSISYLNSFNFDTKEVKSILSIKNFGIEIFSIDSIQSNGDNDLFITYTKNKKLALGTVNITSGDIIFRTFIDGSYIGSFFDPSTQYYSLLYNRSLDNQLILETFTINSQRFSYDQLYFNGFLNNTVFSVFLTYIPNFNSLCFIMNVDGEPRLYSINGEEIELSNITFPENDQQVSSMAVQTTESENPKFYQSIIIKGSHFSSYAFYTLDSSGLVSQTDIPYNIVGFWC